MPLNFYDTLVEADEALRARGYEDQFVFAEGKLENVDSGNRYSPEELSIREYHRFEGMSTPGDSSVLFAIKTVEDEKGTIVMNYSADAEMDLLNFMNHVKIEIPEQSSAN